MDDDPPRSDFHSFASILVGSESPSTVDDLAPRSKFLNMSVLLNPTSEPHQCDMVEKENEDGRERGCQTAVPPKKRGRKPILPKMNNSDRAKYYRAKRKAYSSDLETRVELLRASVSRLVALRDICSELSVCPRNTPTGSLVKLVREYFGQFRHGVQLPPWRRDLLLPEVETSTTDQEVFLGAMLSPDFFFSGLKGVHVLLDQWERYSKYHALVQFELQEVRVLENPSGHIVEAVCQLRTRYSRKTIENVFPHVVGNEDLIQRLIGKEVVYPSFNRFFFSADGRVQNYDVEADFASALLAAIGSLDDVALLLNEARIRQQHMMGEVCEEEEVKAELTRFEELRSESVAPSVGRMGVDFLLSSDEESP